MGAHSRPHYNSNSMLLPGLLIPVWLLALVWILNLTWLVSCPLSLVWALSLVWSMARAWPGWVEVGSESYRVQPRVEPDQVRVYGGREEISGLNDGDEPVPPLLETWSLHVYDYNGRFESLPVLRKLSLFYASPELPPMPKLQELSVEGSEIILPNMPELTSLTIRDSEVTIPELESLECLVIHDSEINFSVLGRMPKLRELRVYRDTSIPHLPYIHSLEKLTLNRHAYVNETIVRTIDDYRRVWLSGFRRKKSARSAFSPA